MNRYCVWASSHPLLPAAPALTLGRDVAVPSHWGISPDPTVESALLPAGARLHLVTPLVPLWLAEAAAERAFPRPGRNDAGRSHWRLWLCRQRARGLLAAWGRSGTIPVAAALQHRPPVAVGNVEAILAVLGQRQLLASELAAAWREQGWGGPAPPVYDLHQLVLAGMVVRRAGVGLAAFGRFECRRCGSQDGVSTAWCARCGGECPECRECAHLGAVRGCSALYNLSPGTERPATGGCLGRKPVLPALSLPFALSPAQVAASSEVQLALRRGMSHVLIWAACGAGKTEVVYGAIQQVLAQGQAVLLATPRRDVTADLCRRLQEVFGADLVAGIYGGTDEKYARAPVLVTTTHQAVRLSGSFGLVVLDECDAFPYSDTAMLQRAVARLRAHAGCFVQMTATPPRQLQMEAKSGRAYLVYIPARYHGHPLPVPVVCREKTLPGWQQLLLRGAPATPLPGALASALLCTRKEQAQLLVFVPRRSLVTPVVEAMRASGATGVDGVHSGTPARDQLRQAFAAGELTVMVATTVFERGLTFAAANVAVLFADTPGVFDAAALVQMAGRVGRSAARPTGDVWFVCGRENKEIREAVSAIRQLNHIARRRGLLASCEEG